MNSESMKVPAVLGHTAGVIFRSDAPLRGDDPGKWTDVPGLSRFVASRGAILNIGLRLKPHGIVGPFKGIHVIGSMGEETCKGGRIIVSAGSDPLFDCFVGRRELAALDFDMLKLPLSVLSELDFSGLPSGDINFEIVSPIGPGASLGTSATMGVALLRACLGSEYPADEIVRMALNAESVKAGRSTGNQDQIASAYGSALHPSSCQRIEIASLLDFEVTPIAVGQSIRNVFDRTIAVHIGSHDSSDIHHALIEEFEQGKEEIAKSKLAAMGKCADLAEESVRADDVEAFSRACASLLEAQTGLSPNLVNATAHSLISLAKECSDEDEPFIGACVPGAGGRGGTVLLHMGGDAAIARFAKQFEKNEEYVECRPYDVRLADQSVI